jgi:hypothetical protein
VEELVVEVGVEVTVVLILTDQIRTSIVTLIFTETSLPIIQKQIRTILHTN